METTLLAWLLAAMMSWAPPMRSGDESRYQEIARDAAEVAFDPEEEPLYPGPEGRAHTALLLLAIASLESRYELEVDDGRRRGDGGRAWCLMQVQPGQGIELTDWTYRYARGGWIGPDLVEDRKKCFRVGLHVARDSFRACRREKLSVYTSGRCIEGQRHARHRLLRASSWMRAHPWHAPNI